jgi:hypothetical protein
MIELLIAYIFVIHAGAKLSFCRFKDAAIVALEKKRCSINIAWSAKMKGGMIEPSTFLIPLALQ